MKKPEDTTIGEIVRITEGDSSLVSCERNGKLKKPCDRWNECVTRLIWEEAANKLREYFDRVTIEDLCDSANGMGLHDCSPAPLE